MLWAGQEKNEERLVWFSFYLLFVVSDGAAACSWNIALFWRANAWRLPFSSIAFYGSNSMTAEIVNYGDIAWRGYGTGKEDEEREGGGKTEQRREGTCLQSWCLP